MLIGEFNHTLDNKGRVIVPSRFREELEDRFIITRGLDSCLFAYPREEWNSLENKLKAMPFTRAEARAFMRLFFSGASEVEPDKQGRILIPPVLREHAELDKEIVFIGVSNRAEIWSKEKWEEYSDKLNLSYEQVAEKMFDIDF
ncbi:MAG TPA: division/cell wall cluster transcriptional repressor MraZ [Firmicutes bacterium]|jgi:MraZ protein|nr:division/cell wall cluster transcriptional repressor MraZ [Bacillota bacterium]